MKQEIKFNKNIIEWAIDRCGKSIGNFDKNLNVNDWIKGTKTPTLKQLEKFSSKAFIPFGYLFLSELPEEKLPITFFRGKNIVEKVHINVYDTILNLKCRQEWLREYLIELGNEKLPYVGKFSLNNNAFEIVNDIREILNLKENWANDFATYEDAQDFLIEKIEDIGIITVFNGVVEDKNKRPIPVKECRGFVLNDNYAPFIFINNSDAKTAQMFTTIHEIAHIWLGKSAGFNSENLLPANDEIEKLCDKVAAEFLVPEKEFNEQWKGISNIRKNANFFKVSRLVILRRAYDFNKITFDEYENYYENLIKEYFEKKQKAPSGGNFYYTTKKRIGRLFGIYIDNAVKNGKLLYRDAYRLTNMKGGTFDKFINKYLY